MHLKTHAKCACLVQSTTQLHSQSYKQTCMHFCSHLLARPYISVGGLVRFVLAPVSRVLKRHREIGTCCRVSSDLHNVYSIGEDLSSLCQTNKWEWKWREKQTEYRNRGNRFWFSMMFCMYWLNPLPVVSGFEPTRNPEEIMQSFVHLLRQLRPSSFRKVGLASMLCTIFTVFLRWNRLLFLCEWPSATPVVILHVTKYLFPNRRAEIHACLLKSRRRLYGDYQSIRDITTLFNALFGRRVTYWWQWQQNKHTLQSLSLRCCRDKTKLAKSKDFCWDQGKPSSIHASSNRFFEVTALCYVRIRADEMATASPLWVSKKSYFF